MKIWLEIQRASGVDKRKLVRHTEQLGEFEGTCPGCGAAPFLVRGQARQRYTRDTYRANGWSKCCDAPVGYLFALVDTLFGLEEDEAVLVNGRARVYGGGLRP